MMSDDPPRFRVRAETRLKNARLIAFRESLGMKQGAFAKMVGIAPGAYCAYETMRIFPVRAHAERLATFIGCEVDELFPPELRALAKKGARRLLIQEAEIAPERLLPGERVSVAVLPAPEHLGPDTRIGYAQLRRTLDDTLALLDPRRREIFLLRCGLEPYDRRHSFVEIGERYGLSSQRTRQLFDQAMERVLRECPDLRGLAEDRGFFH
jgi:transcriptional regulator with XRE-family HTH domain